MTRPNTFVTGFLLALAAAACLLMARPVGAEGARLKLGIGDQKPSTFDDPLFRRLGVRRTRLIVPYNAVLTAAGRTGVDAWMQAARRRRLEVVVAFNPDSRMRCPARPCRAPSVRSYRRAVRKFVRRYRHVRIYQPWNESNSRTQPTSGKRGARLVAKYYSVLRRACRRCTVTGADIQDIGDFTGYTKAFLRAARPRPRIMGFHNYTDTNRFKYRSTDRFIRALPRRMRVWLTETGGIYRFEQQSGVVSLPADERRAARSMSHMFRIWRRHRRRIDRIYVYQWSVNFIGDRFDAGVVNPDSSPRRSYFVLRRYKRYFR